MILTIRHNGTRDAAKALRRLEARLRRPLATAGRMLAQRILAAQTANLESQGRRLGAVWPPLLPSTASERRRKGFPAGPPMHRTGELKRSIEIRSVGDLRVLVGTDHPGAGYLDSLRPFLGVNVEDVDQLAELLVADLCKGLDA